MTRSISGAFFVPRIVLTDLTVRSLKSNGKQVTYWCSLTPGFGVMVSQRGTKAFYVMLGRERRRIHLGKYPATRLADARQRARELIFSPTPPVPKATLAKVFDSFFESSVRSSYRPRPAREMQRMFATYLAPLAHRQISSITTQDVLEVVDALSDTPGQANHVYTLLKRLFSYAQERKLLTASPVSFRRPHKAPQRDRLLSDDELRAIYRAALQIGHPFGHIILLCIHTGMRRSEVAQLKWDYINSRSIELPAALCKNGQPHSIPNLIHPRLEALVPRTSEYLFPSDRGAVFNDWHRQKQALDKIAGVSDWVIHDIRRYFSSTLASLSVPIEIIERLLNHVSGSLSPVAKIYNRHKYFPQMQQALEAYEAKLAQLTNTDAETSLVAGGSIAAAVDKSTGTILYV